MSRYCYNNGSITITPSNVFLIHSAAHFMEIGKDCSATFDLVEQTENFLDGISNWSWSELVVALKHSQDLLPAQDVSILFEKILDCLVGRLGLPIITSPYTTFSENSSFHCSCDTRSTDSRRNYYSASPTTWWFEDLLFLKVDLIEKVIHTMTSQRLDQAMIYKFLIFYLKAGLYNAATADKCKISEIVISLLSLLDRSSLSCKGLFEVHRLVSSLRISEQHRVMLESLIGSRLDQATVNHLLITSPCEKEQMFDVNLVLRLVEAFIFDGNSWISFGQLKKVASLMDSYLFEVAPDLFLKPSKFAALVSAIPDSARRSNDRIYQAVDIYLEVHARLSEAERMSICSATNQNGFHSRQN
ncbi:BTB/POZ domain-containing protein At3g22104-like isoform X2 [Tripterygium wilfordii]|nr:BTB/POZ domain-containing protein At3g22104-like isoform X2 [Tripterygium wilfordii]